MLDLQEDELYTFDAAAADRPVNFIERYCLHYEGAFAGRPFLLHPLQKQIVRDVYGWKVRATGLRRFTDVYFEAAVGAGKSPLLAALGLYGLMADGEKGAQVYSFASTFSQARVVFDCAKRFGKEHPQLAARLEIVNTEIRHPGSGSFWRIVSGKGPGAGCRPTLALGDEAHEWQGGGCYQALRDRMGKRQQPLMIVATNAGESRASFCYQLREKAVAAEAGKGDPGLYPVIWAAPVEAKSEDPAAWACANPLIGTTISLVKVAAKAAEAAKDPFEDQAFRRLYLSLWPNQTAGRWLDLALWDAAAAAVAPPPPADAPWYVGLDLSQRDDLSAATFVRVTPDRLYVSAHFWLPRATAAHYEEKYAVPYREWAAGGHITLLDDATISAGVRARIAAYIVTRTAGGKVAAVCYDRYKADDAVAALEKAKMVCVPVAQGYTVSPGCMELERRLKEPGAVVIAANPVLRFCAENCEVKADDRGNIWPVKPMAKGRYAGNRVKKIDGISALVTAFTEARKHAFKPGAKTWTGSICLI